jgi:cell wall assembly regulator SMI1
MEQNIVTYNETREIKGVFEALVEYYKQNNPRIIESLNPPATDQDLERLEALVSAKLPDDFRALYKMANGQQNVNEPFFLYGYEFMSLRQIENTWQIMKETYDTHPDFQNEEEAQGPVRTLWWHPMWIPFADVESGDYYCLDLLPAASGKFGQIIQFTYDDIVRKHLGFSVTDFLGEYETGLNSGKYFMHPQWNIILAKTDG